MHLWQHLLYLLVALLLHLASVYLDLFLMGMFLIKPYILRVIHLQVLDQSLHFLVEMC